MAKDDIKDMKLARLYCYLLLNSPEMSAVLNNDFYQNEQQNTSETLYRKDSFREIVYRLLVNIDFDSLSDENKRKVIFSDYYPEESKVLKQVYLDDRQNLCQEFHNRICKESLRIPSTNVIFMDFTEDMGLDREYYYDNFNMNIYINTKEDFSAKGPTYLLEMVERGTYLHNLQYMICNMVNMEDRISDAERYVCFSELLKQSVLALLSDGNRVCDREALESADEFCTADVYATYSAYNELEQIFDSCGILDSEVLADFKDERLSFMASLLEQTYYHNEDDEFSEEEYEEKDCILDDSLNYDFSLLSELKQSWLNQNTKNDLFNLFINYLSKSAPNFYGTFLGSSIGDDYINDFNDFDSQEDDSMEEEYGE